MESKFFKEGIVVDVMTEKSHIPMRKVTILEVLESGLVGVQKGIKDAPVRFYPFAKSEIEFCPAVETSSIKRTSGGKA